MALALLLIANGEDASCPSSGDVVGWRRSARAHVAPAPAHLTRRLISRSGEAELVRDGGCLVSRGLRSPGGARLPS